MNSSSRNPLPLCAIIVCALGCAFFPRQAGAVLLDWNSVNWTAGATTQSFDIDAANPGNDVTITVSGGSFGFSEPHSGTTSVGGVSNTGGTGGSGLQLGLDLGNGGGTTVTVTITFNYANGVAANFSIWDVDLADSKNAVDRVGQIYGYTTGGGIVAASSVLTGGAISIAGAGVVATYTGAASTNDSASSTIDVAFNGPNVTSIQFSYGKGANANAGNQWIGLSSIDFSADSATHEVHPALAAVLACFGAVAFRWRRQRLAL